MIPDKLLELTISTEKMTLGEISIFDPDSFSIFSFVKFLRKYSNWSKAEIDGVVLSEMEELSKKVSDAMKELSVPKVPETNSNHGQREDQPQFPSGRDF